MRTPRAACRAADGNLVLATTESERQVVLEHLSTASETQMLSRGQSTGP